MGLRDQIFPPGPPVDGDIIRTEWVGTWESQLLGLGRLTKFLTDRLLSESLGIDDIALYVMFLQRHRVEVGLKLVLERAQGTVPGTHKLQPLMGSAKDAVKSAGLVGPWDRFEGAQAEYIGLVGEIDEGAATFRYPVDRDQHPWLRENYVDLRTFERAGAAFQADALLLVEALSQLEPLPILSADADGTARETARARERVSTDGGCVRALDQRSAGSQPAPDRARTRILGGRNRNPGVGSGDRDIARGRRSGGSAACTHRGFV